MSPGLERCFLFDAIEDSYSITGIKPECRTSIGWMAME